MYTAASSLDGFLAFLDGLCLLADRQDVEIFENWLRAQNGIDGKALALSGLLRMVVEQRPGERSDELDRRQFFAIIEAYVSENVNS